MRQEEEGSVGVPCTLNSQPSRDVHSESEMPDGPSRVMLDNTYNFSGVSRAGTFELTGDRQIFFPTHVHRPPYTTSPGRTLGLVTSMARWPKERRRIMA